MSHLVSYNRLGLDIDCGGPFYLALGRGAFFGSEGQGDIELR